MRLADYLTSRSESIGQFAERIDVSHETVRRYISGERRPEWAVIDRIVSATDGAVTANDFITQENGAC